MDLLVKQLHVEFEPYTCLSICGALSRMILVNMEFIPLDQVV